MDIIINGEMWSGHLHHSVCNLANYIFSLYDIMYISVSDFFLLPLSAVLYYLYDE